MTADSAKAARQIGIDKIGSGYPGHAERDIIYRLDTLPTSTPDFPYIIVSDSVDSADLADLVTVASFPSAKNLLKKKARKGLGVEFLITGARVKSAHDIARWLGSLSEAYLFCKTTHCQFILSSGAARPEELISGKCFDEILAEIGIEPMNYWKELEEWLKGVTSQRVILQ